MHITICIASIGRPSLTRTLNSIASALLKPTDVVEAVIADDSENGEVSRIVSAGGPWPIPIKVIHVASRNISLARNATLEHAQGDYAAFIDDDEWADSGWLTKMLEIATAYKADAVIGPVKAIMPENTEPWLVAAAPYDRAPGPSGTVLRTGITSNALVSLKTINRLRLRFLEELGSTGGEDTEFFGRLSASGGTLIACADAYVYEEVPPVRLDFSHLTRRYARGGFSYARTIVSGAGFLGRFAFYLSAAGKLLVTGLIATVAWPIRRDIAFTYAMSSWGHIGKLMYGVGWPSPQPYKTKSA
jgi:succinoglycan biosynthesis protein ExoM